MSFFFLKLSCRIKSLQIKTDETLVVRQYTLECATRSQSTVHRTARPLEQDER
jgi:hypothetical protein